MTLAEMEVVWRRWEWEKTVAAFKKRCGCSACRDDKTGG